MFTRKVFIVAFTLAIASGLLTACAGSVKGTSSVVGSPSADAAQVQEAISDTMGNSPSLIANTGKMVAESVPAATDTKRLWSGEVFLSENGYPDLPQQIQIDKQPETDGRCISEDVSSSRRYGGCVGE